MFTHGEGIDSQICFPPHPFPLPSSPTALSYRSSIANRSRRLGVVLYTPLIISLRIERILPQWNAIEPRTNNFIHCFASSVYLLPRKYRVAGLDHIQKAQRFQQLMGHGTKIVGPWLFRVPLFHRCARASRSLPSFG